MSESYLFKYKPFLLLLIYSGVYPVSFHQNRLRCSNNQYRYCIVFIILVIGLTSYTFYQVVSLNWDFIISNIFPFSGQVQTFLITITYVGASFTNLAKCETHVRLLNGLQDIEIDLKTILKVDQIDRKDNFENTLKFDVCMISVYFLLELTSGLMSPRRFWFEKVLMYCVIFITITFGLIVLHIKHCVLIWNNRFDIVCQSLNDELKALGKVNIHRIEHLLEFIECLSNLKANLNNSFGFVLLMNSVFDFIAFAKNDSA